ncbi:hypothetical protein PENSPDRAFT_746942 [Peniophora sp. CONT]|nr:hypothetical protein PENSPDRAFT_746942 [Peniophora sp. CONT]
MQAPVTRVIVRLPTARPEQPLSDPEPVIWNAEKEKYMWEQTRSTEAAPDWKALARALDVPLPYLLYRAQARYEQDLRGLQDVRGALSPPTPQAQPQIRPGSYLDGAGSGIGNGSISRNAVPARLGVRARLSSLGNASAARSALNRAAAGDATSGRNKDAASSVLTLRHDGGSSVPAPRRPISPVSSHSGSGSDFDADEEDVEAEKERAAEAQEVLARKLARLQKEMTRDALGLVRGTTGGSSIREKGKGREREPLGASLPHPARLADVAASRSSQSLSGASSPQGSIPSMPSPPPGAQSPAPRSPTRRQAPVQALRYGGLMRQATAAGAAGRSERGSMYGSEASSFSDLSESLEMEGSALDSALASNIRGGGSRFSGFTSRTRASGY